MRYHLSTTHSLRLSRLHKPDGLLGKCGITRRYRILRQAQDGRRCAQDGRRCAQDGRGGAQDGRGGAQDGRGRGIVLIAIAGAVIAGLLLIPSPKHKKQHPPNNDPWLLVSYDPNNKYGTYLSNGFISTRIMGDGVGSQDGKPLPCYMAGLYDNEKLIPCPTWSDLRFYDGKTRFKIDKDADYKQVLNMKTGILTTYATWRAGSKTLKGKIEVIVSRVTPEVGLVKATLTPDFDGSLLASSRIGIPGGDSQVHAVEASTYEIGEHGRVAPTISFVVAAHWPRKPVLGVASTIYVDQDAKSPERGGPTSVGWEGRVKAGRPMRVWSYTAMTTAGAEPYSEAEGRATDALEDPHFVEAHKRAWSDLWRKDIIIDGPAKDQQAIHSCMFYLLQSVREGSKWSIPPMGLSNNAFSGHVFWDADTWMFPALIWQHPQLARSIVEYRYQTLPGAMANAKAHGFAGAEYAWESGYTGKEDTPEGLVYRHERHINGDVALAQWQYYLATNDLNWLKTRGFPVIKATADYWISRVKFNKAANRYEIHQVVPPDENAELVNNSVYTNFIAKLNLEIASKAAKLVKAPADPKWTEIASRMYIPFDAKNNRFLAFDGYKGIDAKQADTELLAYPLQCELPGADMNAVYRNTLTYYGKRVLAGGPAMTASVHAVIAARLGDASAAYNYWRKSFTPFLRGPFNYFNEKKSTFVDNACFLTGAAGTVQAALFGFAGLRMDYLSDAPMGLDRIDPFCLPKQWKSLKITGVQWRGKTYDVEVKPAKKRHVLREQ